MELLVGGGRAGARHARATRRRVRGKKAVAPQGIVVACYVSGSQVQLESSGMLEPEVALPNFVPPRAPSKAVCQGFQVVFPPPPETARVTSVPLGAARQHPHRVQLLHAACHDNSHWVEAVASTVPRPRPLPAGNALVPHLHFLALDEAIDRQAAPQVEVIPRLGVSFAEPQHLR